MPVVMAAAPTTVRVGRRRSRRLGLVVVAGILWLIGRGLGLFGGAPAPEPGGAAGAAAPPPESAALAEATDSPAEPASAASAPTPALAAGTGLEPDRFASLLSAVAARTEAGQFGRALATLQHLGGLPLDAAQHAVVARSRSAVDAALVAAGAGVRALLAESRALAARDAIAALVGDGPEATRRAAMTTAGLDPGWLAPAAPSDRMLPLPRPLPRGRQVRLRGDDPAMATVVDGRADQVTVRIETAAGQTFPTLAVTACEPVGASRDEAIELALAALHAGDPLLARLWWAVVRAGGTLPARAELLAVRLP